MATVLQHAFGTTAFGEFLRSARERRGLTIQQIANETKIPRRLLESLEHGDLGAVPAGMYQRAEIRAYAKAVGLDQTLALSELERALGTRSAASSDRRADSEHDREGLHRRPFLLAAFAIAIVVIGIVTWYGRMTAMPAEEATVDRTRGAEAATRGANAPPPQTTPPQAAFRGAEAPLPQATARGAEATSTQATLGAAEGLPSQTAPAVGLITELVVVTEPAGARVMVDGIGRGVTPVTIRYLSAGEKRVRVIKDGLPAQERTVRVAPAREPTTLIIPLQSPAQ